MCGWLFLDCVVTTKVPPTTYESNIYLFLTKSIRISAPLGRGRRFAYFITQTDRKH